ncbi:unnamed protein product [Rhizophagus irregularis]|uniref:Uncharacterized protein n=1 Tax=Rhizophagus irregularis TaxID=588596 RepID=A0A915ZEE6_9GLOM|nr:unnamed protein product [Rhizophagus irregularis]CAB5371582.1 unnamed protein product [Rhizophagus irregularis]
MKNNTTFEKEGNNYITHFFLTSSIVWKNIYLPSEICKISTGAKDKDILKKLNTKQTDVSKEMAVADVITAPRQVFKPTNRS